MKKIVFIFLLLSASLFAQSIQDVVNSSNTVLSSAGIFQPTSWRNVTGYNSISISISSDKNSATNGVKIYFANLVNNTYRILDSTTTSYTTGTIFKLTLPVIAPYLKVKYTNTNAQQTTFSLVTMLHIGQQLKLSDDGALLSSTFNSYLRSVDAWGAASDTSIYAFGNSYLKVYVTVYDSSAIADTLVFEHYSYAKLGYTTNAIGIRDILTDYLESDNSTIIIPGTMAKTFEINMFRPGTLRIRPKTITGRNVIKTKRIVWTAIN